MSIAENLMKALIGLLILIALILLFSSAASAQCGWVLWERTEQMDTNEQVDLFWRIINAYPDYQQCLQAKETFWQLAKKQAEEEKQKHGQISEITAVANSVIRLYKDNSGKSQEYYCLPGTLDPREPK